MRVLKTTSKKQLVSTIKEVGQVFNHCAKKSKILPVLAWDPKVPEEFFRQKEMVMPKPVYSADRPQLMELLTLLESIRDKVKGEHSVLHWLERTRVSLTQGIRLILEIESESFYEVSSEMYGNSKTKFFKGDTTFLELSQAFAGRMSTCNLNDIHQSVQQYSSAEFAAEIESKLKTRHPLLPVRVEITDQIAARVVAGMSRVRIRDGAKFSMMDVNALWNHEIESHCLTAQNGSQQEICNFLAAGGPRTTMTQEGLAVFYEIYGHTMAQNRFLTLCNRVEAVAKVEAGADFMELYRWFKSVSGNETEAFFQAQRVFRGAPLKGGKPFTKDVVYLAGLLGIHNFLRLAVKNQNRMLVECLVCGRIALEDVPTMAWLRTHGILSPPAFVPTWLENWEGLLSFFSVSAVLTSLDLSSFQEYMEEFRALEDWDLSL